MTSKPLPRYLRVAHWLYAQPQWMSSRDVADKFGVSPKAISDDFAMLRRRSDIIEIQEQKARCKGGHQYLLRVVQIHPYVLDERRCPRRRDCTLVPIDTAITWRDLLSLPWEALAHKYKENVVYRPPSNPPQLA